MNNFVLRYFDKRKIYLSFEDAHKLMAAKIDKRGHAVIRGNVYSTNFNTLLNEIDDDVSEYGRNLGTEIDEKKRNEWLRNNYPDGAFSIKTFRKLNLAPSTTKQLER